LYADFAALKQDIVVVPQRDALHESLAFGDVLRYTAELRLPPDTDRAETEASIANMLGVVGLTERRKTMIRHMSGRHLKRASLANELLGKPSLFSSTKSRPGWTKKPTAG
jgi:ABC-type multidrug transport system ATPase subunit